ncbi:MAG: helix-turn-helix domain-containing protein [Bacteroidaceae bacterium]|nr:helix-turn-helix domain-containing protein [Bacteroidaceae bacterium]
MVEFLTKKERLLRLIEYYTNGVQRLFAVFLGVEAQNVSAWLRRGNFDIDLIYTKCSDISADWLLSGKGEMLKKNPTVYAEAVEVDNPPIVPTTLSRKPGVDILAEVLNSTDGMEICPVQVEGMSISFWHRVRNDSLEPEFHKDDKLALLAYPEGEEDPVPGLLYGINTWSNGMLIRRLYPDGDTDGYIGRAYNREEYPDIKIPKKNICRIYRVLMQVRTL